MKNKIVATKVVDSPKDFKVCTSLIFDNIEDAHKFFNIGNDALVSHFEKNVLNGSVYYVGIHDNIATVFYKRDDKYFSIQYVLHGCYDFTGRKPSGDLQKEAFMAGHQRGAGAYDGDQLSINQIEELYEDWKKEK